MIQPELMTTKEVATYLRIKKRKVYELISARRIPCSRVAGKWLSPKCSLIYGWYKTVRAAATATLRSTVHPSWVVATIHCSIVVLRE